MKKWLGPVSARLLGVPLRWKIIGLVVFLLVLQAGVTMYGTAKDITPFLEGQLDEQALNTAKYLASRSPDYIYRNDLFSLYTVVRDARNSNRNIRYIFIVDGSQRVLANTFGNALPKGLLTANQAPPGQPYRITVINTEEGLIRDLAFPLAGGSLGMIRIGIAEKELVQAYRNLLAGIVLATVLVLFLGILLASLLAGVIAFPFQRLAVASRKVASGDLSYRLPPWPAKDEGGQLTGQFNQMMERLELLTQEIRELSEKRRGLAEQLIKVQEEERRYLARELHDETSQSLASLRLGFKYAEEAASLEEMKLRLAEMRQILDTTFDNLRGLVTELRAAILDEGGLGEAITRYTRDYSRRYGIAVDITLFDGISGIPQEVESSLFRVVQEALTNVTRHARARQVSVILTRRGNDLLLTVEDDGQGFDAEEALANRSGEKKFGLFGMQERVEILGGSLQVESAPAQGTTIYVRIPEVLKDGQDNLALGG